jgi:hypothetical protein
MRGEGEETLIPRGRGRNGDQFWRRFSMVAKDPEEKRPSSWLTKTTGNASQLSRWVWIIGVILLICAIGGIGLGVYISEEAAAHYRPDAVGGSADEGTSSLPVTSTANSAAKGGIAAASSSPHVSPTNTVARREGEPKAFVTAVPAHGHAARNRHHNSRLEAELL